MRVATWNLWWQFGAWRQRQPAITDELRAVAADIVLLQEVWASDTDDQARGLADTLGLAVERTTHGDHLRPQKFGNAVLSRWPIERVEQLALTGPGGAPSHRSALACRVATPAGPLLVVVTHLAWQYDQSIVRQRQLTEVVELIGRHADPDRPVVVGGDLNAGPDSDEIRRLTGLSAPYGDGIVFTDSWAAVGDGPGYTWSRENPNAADALWPRRRLDYVLVSWPRPKPWCNPRAAALFGTTERHGVVPSDHYGVVVDLDDRPNDEEAA
ncbi:MAG: endonuclease/exonuclease/phosphatase family protein [Acidimicrobiales bacterium]